LVGKQTPPTPTTFSTYFFLLFAKHLTPDPTLKKKFSSAWQRSILSLCMWAVPSGSTNDYFVLKHLKSENILETKQKIC
jgi:hypothetical protein